MLELGSSRRPAAIGARPRRGAGRLTTSLIELSGHQLPRHFVPDFARQFLQLDERASRPQPPLLLERQLTDDLRNPGFKFTIHG
jgi:hypothetical protein